jgi:glycosyltransferase involved in cell wall biosynthesis
VTTCNLHGSEEIKNDIRVTLDSIAEHCSADVLVVDDGSPTEYQEYVKDLCKHRGFRFVGIWNNGGISHAKNLCLSEFIEDRRYEYLIMLDDDVKVISDEFESTYTTAMERAGVGILSWHDPAYTGAAAEPDGELLASNHTCGCCVVVSRECVQATSFYNVMPGKWGREHSEYYQRAAAKFAKPGVYLDVPNSQSLLVLASNASVFTHEEKLASNEINRIYLGAEQ